MTLKELKQWKCRAEKCVEIYKNNGKDTSTAKVTIPVNKFLDLTDTAINTLEQKEKSEYEHDHEVVKAYNDGQAYILDKIRAEVEGKIIKRPKMDFRYGERDHNEALLDVLDIIDKYRGDTDVFDK